MAFYWRLTGSFAGLSFVGAWLVIISYCTVAQLRKHPTNMVFYLSLCDMFFSIKFFVTAIHPDSTSLVGIPMVCITQAVWAQFWGLASITWNGLISLNLIINLRSQGFTKTSKFAPLYHVICWVLAASTTILIFVADRWARMENDPIIGPSGDGTCWVESYKSPFKLLFFVPLVVYFFIALTAIVLSFINTQTVSGLSDSSRRGVMLRMILYVAVFVLCWSGPIAHRIMQFVKQTNPDLAVEITPMDYWDGIGITIQGFANSMVWLTNPTFLNSLRTGFARRYNRFLRMSTRSPESQDLLSVKSASDSRQDFSKLDIVLRMNIITCVLIGIRSSLVDQVLGVSSSLHGSSVSKQHIELINLSQKHYHEVKKYSFDDQSNARRDSISNVTLPAGYRFIDFCPAVFAKIRHLSGISAHEYMAAVSPDIFLGKASEQLQNFTKGRSGSFFIFSPERKYILKTLQPEEAATLKNILPHMHQYILANPSTLITRYYGLHAVRVPSGQKVYITVMGNVFDMPIKIHEVYDLKGSWVNRKVGKTHEEDPSQLGMDMDLKRCIKMSPKLKTQFLEQIANDANFMASLNIMDYSLLLGFHFLHPEDSRPSAHKAPVASSPSLSAKDQEDPYIDFPNTISRIISPNHSEIYLVGIIDTLQLYNTQKKAERCFKVWFLRKSKRGLSSMPPQDYAKRFIAAMHHLAA